MHASSGPCASCGEAESRGEDGLFISGRECVGENDVKAGFGLFSAGPLVALLPCSCCCWGC